MEREGGQRQTGIETDRQTDRQRLVGRQRQRKGDRERKRRERG